jgi:hypothetical protein
MFFRLGEKILGDPNVCANIERETICKTYVKVKQKLRSGYKTKLKSYPLAEIKDFIKKHESQFSFVLYTVKHSKPTCESPFCSFVQRCAQYIAQKSPCLSYPLTILF